MSHEADVVVAAQLGDLGADPRRPGKSLVLAFELELRDDETFVLAVEFVDLPRHAAVLDEVARLLDERPLGEREQLASLVERNAILVLLARCDETARFDVEPRLV